VIVASVLAMSSGARAENSVTVGVGASQSDAQYSYGWDWSWGDPAVYSLGFARNGLVAGYSDGAWGAGFSAGMPFGAHPNDWPGYRAFIPRGLEGPPQYYGAPPGGTPTTPYPYWPPRSTPYAYYSGWPVVLNYGYGYAYGQPQVIYTAPSNPQYGYVRPSYGQYAYGQPSWCEQPAPQVYNDNRVYNYYYGAQQQPAAQPAPVQPLAPPAVPQDFIGPLPPSAPQPPAAPGAPASGKPYGMRFYEQTRVATPEGTYRCALLGGKLTGALENGQPFLISTDAGMQFGAFAAYEPGAGFSVIFREGGSLVAAYPTAGNEWWLEPLPYAVDFNQDVDLGLVGGKVWVVFSALEGTRYVVSFAGRQWWEVGSGTTQPRSAGK
jgi:hypothetical protein